MLLTDEEFEQVALDEPDQKWELWSGEPRRKPGGTALHDDVYSYLAFMLGRQIERQSYRIRANGGHVRGAQRSYFVPDVMVVPTRLYRLIEHEENTLEAYAEPLPLVVEVWSRTTGGHDLTRKLDEYRRRGDYEIWLIHPYNRTVTAWRRRPDGSYSEHLITDSSVQPAFLPNVTIDLDELFE